MRFASFVFAFASHTAAEHHAAADTIRAVAMPSGLVASTGDDDEPEAVLSRECSHIRRGDVSFLLPHVQHMLTPSGTNSSWRSLFNLAPAHFSRSSSRHIGKVFGVGLSKTGGEGNGCPPVTAPLSSHLAELPPNWQ